MQFQDDWPVLFIRGADAIPVAVAIRGLESRLKEVPDAQIVLALRVLRPYADMIERDVIGTHDP